MPAIIYNNIIAEKICYNVIEEGKLSRGVKKKQRDPCGSCLFRKWKCQLIFAILVLENFKYISENWYVQQNKTEEKKIIKKFVPLIFKITK